jgi:hypothetical protein
MATLIGVLCGMAAVHGCLIPRGVAAEANTLLWTLMCANGVLAVVGWVDGGWVAWFVRVAGCSLMRCSVRSRGRYTREHIPTTSTSLVMISLAFLEAIQENWLHSMIVYGRACPVHSSNGIPPVYA